MDVFPKGIRLATPEEADDATLFGPPAGPTVVGQPNVKGQSFCCPKCGFEVVRNMSSGYRIEMNLKCSSCGALTRLVY